MKPCRVHDIVEQGALQVAMRCLFAVDFRRRNHRYHGLRWAGIELVISRLMPSVNPDTYGRYCLSHTGDKR